MQGWSVLVTVLGWHALSTSAQVVLREQIWGSVIYTLYGDRTPYILPESGALTPLGAQQLYDAGTTFRNRYLIPPDRFFSEYSVSTLINGISEFELDNDQVTLQSTADQFIVASAQAFMQGLYPPLALASNDTFVTGGSSLANGSNIIGPLNGYQYPQIYTSSKNDDNSIWVAGEVNCPSYTASQSDYFSSARFQAIQSDTESFYTSLQPDFLDGTFTNASVGYADAYYIWDYLQYSVTHNTSVANRISESDLSNARALASDLMFALNGDVSTPGSSSDARMRAIAGSALATRIVEGLYTNLDSDGLYDKMTLLFGSFEPMIAFASLAGLASDMYPQFYNIPNPGSSMVFELFSYTTNVTQDYPDRSDLNIRFLFQNGSENGADLISYSLFGQGPDQDTMTLDDFINAMQNIWISSVADWCTACNSYSVFCPAFVDDNGAGSSPTTGSGSSGTSSGHSGISAAVAGVIGAIVTLAVIGLVAAAAMILGGLRVSRVRRRSKSELGGFKGGEKLASDQDLSIAKNGAAVAVTDVPGADAPRGHERVGSWELGEQAKAKEAQMPPLPAGRGMGGRRSFDDEDLHISPFSSPVKPDDKV